MADANGTGGTGSAISGFGNLLVLADSAAADRLNAFQLVIQGRREAKLIREEGVRTQSAQLVGFAKSGVEISGTPLDVLVETARIAEENAKTTISEARAKSTALKAKSKAKKKAVIIGGISSLFSGGS